MSKRDKLEIEKWGRILSPDERKIQKIWEQGETKQARKTEMAFWKNLGSRPF